jgi:hypothetical protein
LSAIATSIFRYIFPFFSFLPQEDPLLLAERETASAVPLANLNGTENEIEKNNVFNIPRTTSTSGGVGERPMKSPPSDNDANNM